MDNTTLSAMNKIPQDIAMHIAKNVKSRRLEMDITQKELSMRAGIKLPTYQRFERTGEISLPTLLQIARTLNVLQDFEHLFTYRQYQPIDNILAKKYVKQEHDTTDRVSLNLYNYTSIEAKSEGQRFVSYEILDVFRNDSFNNVSIPGNKAAYYLNKARIRWTENVLARAVIETGRSAKDILTEYNNIGKEIIDNAKNVDEFNSLDAAFDEELPEEKHREEIIEAKRDYLDKLLGGNNKSEQAQNLYAVWCELNLNNKFALDYLNDLFDNPILGKIFSEVNRDLDEINDEENAESNPELNDYSELDVEDALTEPDTTVASYDHSGIKKDFKDHVSDIIKVYFDTLPKLTAFEDRKFDTNNHFGLRNRMSSQECIQFLNSINEEFDDVSSMIDAIERNARNISKFHGLIRFVNDLRSDDAFAKEIWSIFGKPKYENVELRVQDNSTLTDVANKRVNKRSSMYYDFMNNIKTSVIDNSYDNMKAMSDQLLFDVKQIKTLTNDINDKNLPQDYKDKAEADLKVLKPKVIADITKLLKLYFPDVEPEAIRAYIELNDGANESDIKFYGNCLDLYGIIEGIVKKHKGNVESYRLRQQDINAVIEHNRRLKAARTKGWVPDSEFKNASQYKTDNYIHNQQVNVFGLIDRLLPYTVGNIRLNDRNIYGNNQSSILNNSWIGALKHMMDKFYKGVDANGREVLKNDELVAWGIRKLFSVPQYRYSSLLVEQTDENGNILNKDTAIFRMVNGTVELTKNADKLLKIMTFNGSSNINEGTNMGYTKMNSGDYFPTSYMMFYTTKGENGLDLATYFPRVPSDAPTCFAIRSARHDASNLYKIKNPEQVYNNILGIINDSVPLISGAEFAEQYMSDAGLNDQANYFTTVYDTELVNKLTNPLHRIISNAQSIKPITKPDDNGEFEAYVTYKTESGVTFVSKGTVYNIGKAKGLKNASLVGVVDVNPDARIKYKELPDEIVNALFNYYIKRLDKSNVVVGEKVYSKTEYECDVDHPVFKLIRNQFKQEMIDAANAVSHYFEIRKKDNGRYEVVLEKGKNGIYKPITKKGVDINRGYDHYHVKGDKVIKFNSNGTFHFSGDVFHSSNFIAKGINFFEDIINEDCDPIREDDGSINLLYGGAMELICDDNGNVVDVAFTEKQLDKINECMLGFMNAYIDQVSELIYKNRKFIKNVPVTQDNIVNYAANELLMYFNFDYILDGSPKYYKSKQDVIKRVKQYQGSGNLYGSANFSANFVPNVNEAEHSFLNNGTIPTLVTVDGKKQVQEIPVRDILEQYPIFKGLRERNGFYAVTIANTKRTNTKALEILRNKLIKECGITEDHADELIYGSEETDKKTGKKVRTKGYQSTKVNDAQSYITIQEFIRRLSAKGQLKRYMPLIKRLMDESKPISAADISEFIQVQKNFYFDMWVDERYRIEVTRQIKNAEFVLIPRFIKGTQLERVYEAMIEAGVDQLNTVETSKAANEKVLQLWDNDANFDEKVVAKFIKDAKQDKQIYSYNYLYTQQETPQHLDAQNKASIQIMKKMFDNIPMEGHPLSKVKREFFATYATNIKAASVALLKRFDVPLDEKGDIIVNNDGTIERYNSKVLYDRMLEEARRTGVNDNQKDYFVIPEGELAPLMVSFMNNYQTKLESVFQSMFNSSVTRQKLPGFHSAQITNVGFKPYGTENKVLYAQELEYHPDGEPYITVMVPYKALGVDKNSDHYKNMTDDRIIEELDKKGLLEFVGYRIPTEGKQSTAVMRVVGFIDDAYGSTIVVPDDWVSQTGSNFEIDSVYSILHEHATNRNGEVVKIDYKEADKRTKADWINYLRETARKLYPKTNSIIKKLASDLNKETNSLLKEKQGAYDKLSKDNKAIVKDSITRTKKKQKNKDLTKQDKYIQLLDNVVKAIDKAIKKGNNSEQLKHFRDVCESIADKIDNFEDNVSEFKFSELNKLAKDNGLLTFEEFTLPENDLTANTRKARNSRIADLMLTVLRDPASLEENLSRSNFDKITEAKARKMDKDILAERENRNPHDICAQVSYQEEVMSGRELKGMSVALDTMCSVCNTVRPTLEEPVTIVYNADEIDQESVKKGFKGKVNKDKNTATVTHTTYGWSDNNRCVDGYYLTVYSSQTTAYILDAVKEGSILNVNTFTFPAWKTLCNIGCSYGVSIAFITQPAVSEIVREHNNKNSVFVKGYGNEINQAIKNICKRIDPTINTNDNLASILSEINKKHKDKIQEIFGVTGEDITFSMNPASLAKIPIVAKLLDDRNSKSGKFKDPNSLESAIFDLGVALIYSRLHGIAARISRIARCCTPDKFGAKQTVYATRKIFDDILGCIYKEETIFEDIDEVGVVITTARKEKKHILDVNGKHILEAIYPGVSDVKINENKDSIITNIVRNGDVSKSAYPPLFAFLKYATCASIVMAKKVFETQDRTFVNVIEQLGNTFSGTNKEVPEEVYVDFQRYILSCMYKNVPSIKYPIQVRKVNGKIKFTIPKPTASNASIAKEETARIWGFGKDSQLQSPVEEEYITKSGITRKRTVYKEFNVVNVAKPTKAELEEYEKLSPAQKIYFIKTRFRNPEIFGFVRVNLSSTRKYGRYKNAQTIEFIEENNNPNDMFRMFKRAFESDNPLIVSAAIDIIKYAVQVEGMQISATAVNKIIDNDALINNLEDGTGLSFISSIREQMRNFGTNAGICGDALNIRQTYENYLRTLPANIPIRTLNLTKTNTKQFNIDAVAYNTYRVMADATSDDPAENLAEFNKKLVRMGIKYTTIVDREYVLNDYIYLNTPVEGVMLYKIHDLGNQVILTPLTKLERGENSEWSANPDNNGSSFISPSAYDKLIASYRMDAVNNQGFTSLYVRGKVKTIKLNNKDAEISYKDPNAKIKRSSNAGFDIEDLARHDNGKALSLKHDIVEHFTNFPTEPLFVNNGLISENIFTPGSDKGTIQKIKFPNGTTHQFSIYIPRNISSIEQRYLRPKKGVEKQDPNSFPFESGREIIRKAQEDGSRYLSDMAIVEQIDSIGAIAEEEEELVNYATVEDKYLERDAEAKN